jgi:hypothetical protein
MYAMVQGSPLAEGDYTTKSVACRLTTDDYAKLLDKKPQGKLLSEFLREILKEYINK